MAYLKMYGTNYIAEEKMSLADSYAVDYLEWVRIQAKNHGVADSVIDSNINDVLALIGTGTPQTVETPTTLTDIQASFSTLAKIFTDNGTDTSLSVYSGRVNNLTTQVCKRYKNMIYAKFEFNTSQTMEGSTIVYIPSLTSTLSFAYMNFPLFIYNNTDAISYYTKNVSATYTSGQSLRNPQYVGQYSISGNKNFTVEGIVYY